MTDREIMRQALDALDNHNGNYKLTVAECNVINKVCDNLRQALAQPEQEPYCWVQSKLSQGMFYKEKPRRIHTMPLYTTPPKQWVGLTGLEISHYNSRLSGSGVAEEIEARLKEKNT